MSEDSQYWDQFKGSATANTVFVVVYFLYKYIESHCKHSRCSSKTKCCKCSVDNDDDTIKQRKHGIRHQESLQTVYTTDDKKVPPRHKETV